jgi:predicted DNA-binding protein with PD1-like motif
MPDAAPKLKTLANITERVAAMQYEEGKIGRIFVLKLETGERIPDIIEEFAHEHGVRSAMVMYVGGAGEESRLVVGPDASWNDKIVPLVHALDGRHEVLAVGTLYPDEEGNPILHMHAAMGREGKAVAGCTRAGVDVWLVGEVLMIEIAGTTGLRKTDTETGFKILQLAGFGRQ